jgi:hypothetical protein
MPRLTGNQDPAEGSRETINHELARQSGKQGKSNKAARPKQNAKNPPVAQQKRPRGG